MLSVMVFTFLAAQTAVPTATPEATPQPAPPQERRICRTVRETSTRMSNRRVCRTASEWRALDGDHQNDLESSRRQNGEGAR